PIHVCSRGCPTSPLWTIFSPATFRASISSAGERPPKPNRFIKTLIFQIRSVRRGLSIPCSIMERAASMVISSSVTGGLLGRSRSLGRYPNHRGQGIGRGPHQVDDPILVQVPAIYAG